MTEQGRSDVQRGDGGPDEGGAVFGVVVIGAGPVGENAADAARAGRLTVAVMDTELVAGESSYRACMPSKALLRSGQVLRVALSVSGALEAVTGALDAGAVIGRRDAFASHDDDRNQASWLDGTALAMVRGYGRLAGGRRVQVTGADGSTTLLIARHAVVLANGTAAVVPPVPRLAQARPWTRREGRPGRRRRAGSQCSARTWSPPSWRRPGAIQAASR